MGAIRILPGLTVNSIPANDDGYSGLVTLPFALDFFGTTFNTCRVNNNGNVTLGDTPLATYTPFGIPNSTIPIIGVFFGDWDTRSNGSSLVTYGVDTLPDGRAVFGVNYLGIGYYAYKTDKLNSCQLLLIDDSALSGAGAFSIEFNYGNDSGAGIQWETGDASGGHNGLGGVSAAVGYSKGTQEQGTFYEFPGSRVPGSFLDNSWDTGLIHFHANSTVKGRYVFLVRGGIPAPIDPPPAASSPITPPPTTIPTGDLVGTVTTDGTGAADVAVPLRAVDADPDYRIERLPVGLYSVFLGRCGFLPQMTLATIHPNRVTTLDATLPALTIDEAASGSLYGWAFDVVQGVPLALAQVTATDAGGTAYTGETDAAGGWLLTLPPGTYTLSVTMGGYGTQDWPTPLTIEPGCSVPAGVVGVVPPPDADGDAALVGYTEDATTQAALGGVALSLVEAPSYRAVSDADGLYGVSPLPAPALLTLYATKTGYRPRHSVFATQSAATVRLDVGLVPTTVAVGSVDGFVTDALTSRPVAGAVVRCPGVTQAVTNGLGYFLLSDLPTGAMPVQVLADGYLPAQAVVTVTDGATTRQNFALADGTAGAAFVGQVRDAVTGAGVVGAALTADALTGTSGARGAYVLAPVPVPPRTHALTVNAAGFWPLSLADLPADAGDVVELDLGLVSLSTPVGALHGYVFDARRPAVRLGGARVSLGRFLQTLATYPNGEYVVPVVPSALPMAATATRDGYLPLTYAGVEVDTHGVLELDFPLTGFGDLVQTGTLTVTVLEAGSGRPIAGAAVDTGAFGVPVGVTGADGTVTLTGLPFGDYDVAATAPNYRVGVVPASVGSDPATARIELSGWPDWYVGGQVYGHVTARLTPPGGAVPNCLAEGRTETLEADALTDARGFYVLDEVPSSDGPCAVTFDQPDYVPYTAPAVAVANHAAVRVDAALSPWDGRLPDGWRQAMGAAVALSRPCAFVTATLDATEAVVEARRADTLCLVAGEDTPALGRFRRVRYGVRAERPDSSDTLKVCLALAPGVTVKGMPGVMAIAVPPVEEK